MLVLGDFLGVSLLEVVNMAKLGMPPRGKLTKGVLLALFRACELQLAEQHGRKISAAKQVLAAFDFLRHLSRDLGKHREHLRKKQDDSPQVPFRPVTGGEGC